MDVIRQSNNPLAVAAFMSAASNRKEKAVVSYPIEKLTPPDFTVINVALNNIVSEGSILSDDIARDLSLATQFIYQVAPDENHLTYSTTILVIEKGYENAFEINIYNKDTGQLTVKKYLVEVKTHTPLYSDAPFNRGEYLESATRLIHEAGIQYSENLAESYKFLFYLIFFTEIKITAPLNDVAARLKAILNGTEVTLNLNVTKTVKLYGHIDDKLYIHLYVREIGTPDTFWIRTASIPEIHGQIFAG